MAITVKYLEGLGIEKETAEKIFAERGKEIELEKAKYSELNQKLEDKTKDFDNISAEFDKLKEANADAAEWEKKFNDLTAEIKEKEKKAEDDRKAAEKAQMVADRFNAVLGDKEFTHDAIKADYERRFGEALDSKDFIGKSDSEIFHELTKEDGAAFKNVEKMKLPGGAGRDFNVGQDTDLENLDMADYINARKQMKG